MKLSHILLPIAVAIALTGCSQAPTPEDTSAAPVEIYPDYASVTFPVNIAAPAFEPLIEGADAAHLLVGIKGKEPVISVRGDGLSLLPPLNQWHELLQEAAGGDIYFRILTRTDGHWTQHPDITATISPDSIDSHIAYRMLYPGYELWRRVGIYQRDLTGYAQTPILENKDMDGNCLNCHSFAANNPATLQIHLRGKHKGTLIARDGEVSKVMPSNPSLPNGATYPTWHPDGRFIAYSTNDVMQGFHTFGTKPIEVVDMSADIMVYDTETGKSFTSPAVADTAFFETFPAWDPVSGDIWFARAKARTADESLTSTRYDLCRIPFDQSTGAFGDTVVTVYPAADMGKSVSFPRVSPDGRHLMFTLSDYGTFSIWHPESQLMLLDLATGLVRPLDEVNDPESVDSYHTWSSTGRWFAFSSKRLDGLAARPFIACFDPATGRAGKPFVMPQKSSRYYDDQSLTYNVPELITGPVTITDKLLDTALSD
ncbi:MAG: hypothetical protein NC342_05630 [Pseudoflavonifractor sp.]|nr:cytochrome C biosynthesis protein [Alloprevotella sp.]MCM1116997.1 hypothetical protein [Pseudoflavonifractor sp.]